MKVKVLKLDLESNVCKMAKKCTKYFLGLEKARAANKTITSLRDNTGTIYTDQNTMHDKITEHYQKLYTPKFNFKDRIYYFQDFTEGLEIPQIKESDKLEREERITLPERTK